MIRIFMSAMPSYWSLLVKTIPQNEKYQKYKTDSKPVEHEYCTDRGEKRNFILPYGSWLKIFRVSVQNLK